MSNGKNFFRIVVPAITGTAVTALALATAPVYGQAKPAAKSVRPATAAAKQRPQRVVVHLSSSEGDHALHSGFMAIGLATALKGKGADVTLMLDSTVPNLMRKDWADKTLRPSGTEPTVSSVSSATPPMQLGNLIASFVKAGGRILMCPHCTEHCGIITGNMVAGALVAQVGGLAVLVFDADKVVDY